MTLAMCVAISCISLLLQVFMRPYGTAESNRHEAILLAVQLTTLLIGGASNTSPMRARRVHAKHWCTYHSITRARCAADPHRGPSLSLSLSLSLSVSLFLSLSLARFLSRSQERRGCTAMIMGTQTATPPVFRLCSCPCKSCAWAAPYLLHTTLACTVTATPNSRNQPD